MSLSCGNINPISGFLFTVVSLVISMTAGAIAAIIYGLFSFVGGILGYTTARSTPSLIAGVISGLLLIGAGILALTGTGWAIPAAAVITALLVIVFVVRLFKTKKFLPAGLMVTVGVAALVVMVAG